MGVVRREGDWRLEKVEEGLYEITYQKEEQIMVVTSDHQPDNFFGVGFDTIPAKEVDSYSEAVGLFEEKAHGPPPFDIGSVGGIFGSSSSSAFIRSSTNSSDTGSNEDIDAPPWAIALGFLLAGGFIIHTYWFSYNSMTFQIGVVFLLAGLAIIGWAAIIYRRQGLGAATEFFFDRGIGKSQSSTSSNTEKTPPAPRSLREELMFERANHHCEWCGERYDRLQVHHIVPRNEGGPNTKRNLIALCPTCHDKADHGGISRTQLRGKVRRVAAE